MEVPTACVGSTGGPPARGSGWPHTFKSGWCYRLSAPLPRTIFPKDAAHQSHTSASPCALPPAQIIFPEKAGALSRFLSTVSPTWNVTLFHYRNTGNRESSVLLGVQVRARASFFLP